MSKFNLTKTLRFPVPFKSVYPVYWLAALVVLVGLDLASKKAITETLNFHLSLSQAQNEQIGPEHKALYAERDQINILGEGGKWIKFRLVFNDRFVFGSGPSAPVLGFFATLTAIIFLFLYRWHNHDLGHPIAWLFVFSGALGNLVDKMFVKSMLTREWVFSITPQPGHVSGVVDFVECIWFGWSQFADVPLLGWLAWRSWPTFNLADSLIVVSIFWLLLTIRWREDDQTEDAKKPVKG